MRAIKVVAGPDNREKLLECVAAFGQPGCVRRQVAGVDHQRADASDPFSRKRTKRCAAAQVALSICQLRLSEKWITASRPFAAEVGAVVATVTVALRVDDVAAFS